MMERKEIIDVCWSTNVRRLILRIFREIIKNLDLNVTFIRNALKNA